MRVHLQFQISFKPDNIMIVEDQRLRTTIQATTLTVSLLKTVATTHLGDFGKSKLNRLNVLSNRIKLANQQYKPNYYKVADVRDQLSQKDIDICKETRAAYQLKAIIQSKLAKIRRKPAPEINLDFDFRAFKSQELTHKAEQIAALKGIYETLNKNQLKQKPNSTSNESNHLKQLKRLNVIRMRSPPKAAQSQKKSKANTQVPSQTKLKLQPKLSLSQLRTKFASLIGSASFSNIHTQMYQRFARRQMFNERYSQRWLLVLYYQVEMASRFCRQLDEFFIQVQFSGKAVNNFISMATLQALDKLFEMIYLQRKSLFQQNYFINTGATNPNQLWLELYFLLRNHKKGQFLNKLRQQDSALAQQFSKILHNLQQQIKPDYLLNTVAANQFSSHFEKILKLLILGKHDNLFKEVQLKTRALQQPWFILLALSFDRQTAKQQTLRLKSLKQALSDYYNSLINNALNLPIDHELVLNFMTGLVSLGNYKLLLSFYNELSEKCKIHNQQCYFDFVHVFIILAANPKVVLAQTIGIEASQIFKKMMSEIVDYVQSLKMANSEHFKVYFTLILHISAQLSNPTLNLNLQKFIQQLCCSLIVKFQDLKLINLSDLQFDFEKNRHLVNLQTAIINHIRPDSQLHFIQLVQFCDSIGYQHLQEPILIKLIIVNYLKTDKILQLIQEGHDLAKQLKETVLSRDVAIAEDYLSNSRDQQLKDVLNFMKDIKKLRSYVLQRKEAALRTEQKQLARYRAKNQSILFYINSLDRSNSTGLLDIFASYYQKLDQMYRIKYFSRNNQDAIDSQRFELLKELKGLKNKYGKMESVAYNKVVRLLEQ